MNRFTGTAYYNCATVTSKWYMGVYAASGDREIFRFDRTPEDADRLPYIYVVGPFETERGATVMASSYNNPHIRCVADAEKLSREVFI